jgi:hypothetical protein
MYGKFFASTFTGSMCGAGANVFAVWGYVIAHTVKSTIEINPSLLSRILGIPESDLLKAMSFLMAPDPRSRNPAEEGRRLVHEGAFQYRVVTHEFYRNIRHEDDRRAYNRKAQADHRAKKAAEAAAKKTPDGNA